MNEMTRRIFTPTELNRDVRIHLEAGFGLIDVEGEVSNLARPASGHLYFSLKDAKAQIRCAMFRNRASLMRARLENGQQVRATARVSLYEPRGDFQLIIERVAAAGEGRLQQLYDELKRKLTAEGLFDPTRKQPLPQFPRRIGLITSPSGAAVRDLLHVLERRYPLAEVRIYPSAVQGADAPRELRTALHHAIQESVADVLIIGRGGGSLEDLWAFNDEALVRAVAGCPIPIISAVGHEVDFSLCDEAADIRAPTPSAAAEIATPDQRALQQHLYQVRQRLQRENQRRLNEISQRIDFLNKRLLQAHPYRRLAALEQRLQHSIRQLQHLISTQLQLGRQRQRAAQNRLMQQHPGRKLRSNNEQLDLLKKRFQRAFQTNVKSQRLRLMSTLRALHLASPLATLARGYAIPIDTDTQHTIANFQQAQATKQIRLLGQDYEIIATVESVSDKTPWQQSN